MNDYYEIKADNRKDITVEYFRSYRRFEAKIKEIFREYDEARRAQERLVGLR